MKTYTPPYIKPKRLITPNDIFKRKPGVNIYEENDDLNSVLLELLGDRLAANMDEISNRLEWMAAQATFFGKYQVTGDGYDHLIDFQLPATHNVALAGGAKWDQATATPLDDLQSASRNNRDDGAVVSDIAIFSSSAWNLFKGHANTLKFFTNLRDVTLGSINPVPQDKTVTYCGTYRDADTALDLFVYTGFFTADDGSATRYIPDDYVFVGSTQATGNQELYGAIQDLKAGTFRQKVFTKLIEEDDPSCIEVLSQSAPLLALLEPKAGTVIKVK
jgi:hypothetical protein